MGPHIFKRKLKIIGVISLFLTVLLSACRSENYPVDHEQVSKEDRIVIRFSHIVGENTPKGLAARRFAKLVNERTDGFVEVQVFPNGYLYRDGEEMEALVKGDIQMVAPATSKLSSIAPEWEVIDLPFAFQDSDEVREYLQSEVGEILFEKLETNGFHKLAVWDNGLKQMTNNVHPLISTDDFSGLKFRIMPSSVINNQFLQLNATTRSDSFSEVYKLLERKDIDAQENTFSNIVSKNLYSLQDYLTISNHGYLGYVVLMNNDFWEELPEDVQTIIQETMDEVTKWEAQKAKELNEKNLQDLKECNCIDIHILSEEEKKQWEDALAPVYQRFEDRYGAEYIKNLPKYSKGEKPN